MSKTPEEIFQKNWGLNPQYSDDREKALSKFFAIEAMKEYADQFKPVWIDVKKQTPELIEGKDYSENVLAIINNRLGVACYCFHYEPEGENNGYYWASCGGNIDGDADWDDDYEVTHWQPLPQPPLYGLKI